MRHSLVFMMIIKLLISFVLYSTAVFGQEDKRQRYLQQLIKVLPKDRYSPEDELPAARNVSPVDFSWSNWLDRTGELPPNFEELPSLPFLPDPLVLDEGGENIPIKTIEQWLLQRQQIKEKAQHWITGTLPPPPDNLAVEVLEEKKIGQLKELDVLLRFGPGLKAQLHITLLIPPGDGPFPVFMCPWKKDRYDYVQAAVRRGYIACRFTATDPNYGYPDDSEEYEKIWWPEYDFSTLMRWGWGASRAIDYLYTLEYVNKEQIALTGLSRNGKMALWAAAFDERIKAVVPISGGTGSENPFRYTSEKFDNESIAQITTNFPHWLHPRLRFFVGREHKLPIDQNSLMALIAPRGLMITSSIFENQGNPWGIEQAYLSAREAYKFLGAEENIAIDMRHGLHSPSARDMERYLDFFDYVFGRGNIKPENKLYYNYTFSRWLGLSGEIIDPHSYESKGINDLLIDSQGWVITDSSAWIKKVPDIRQRINWGLGYEPSSLAPGRQPDYMHNIVIRPPLGQGTNSIPVGFGTLYYPTQDNFPEENDHSLPVVIFLHEYSYSTGYGRHFQPLLDEFLSHGFAVYAMDQIGFGTRIEEGHLFYERFPHWSKMGRMVADVRWSVDLLSEIEFINPHQIFIVGYALGGTIGLYSASLDDRIAGVASICGFTPMRPDTQEKGTEGILRYSHLHGLLPRLGFFVGEEDKIPYDFDEILGCIAPRPLFIIAPSWDRFATHENVQQCVNEVRNIYSLYNANQNLEILTPDDYNRFSQEMQKQIIQWLGNH